MGRRGIAAWRGGDGARGNCCACVRKLLPQPLAWEYSLPSHKHFEFPTISIIHFTIKQHPL